MKLQTLIPLNTAKHQIDYHSKILLLGSCFAENIGHKLAYFKFQNTINPFGVLFHPQAIEYLVINALQNKIYTERDLFFYNEQWHCFNAHSKLSNPSKKNVLKTLNEQLKLTQQQLLEATHIVITLGTSWVYKHVEKDQIVANCHKLPQQTFVKKILSIESIKTALEQIILQIKALNPKAEIIFTISPIRHLKDGFVENMQSKAHLIAAIHNVLTSNNKLLNSAIYFPSYEIMMDELRDYRFYADDMIHPNTMAINYIWEKFKQVWISDNAVPTMKKVDTVQKGLQHKPFNLENEKHKLFQEHLIKSATELNKQFNHITF